MRLTTWTVAALFAAIGLAGCKPEPRTTTMHEPGVYKGARDPLLESQQHQELVDRLALVQKDR